MNIYVGNLSFHVDDQRLYETFAAFGEVRSARVIRDRETGRSRGFGFVEMPNESEAKTAIQALNGAEHQGRTLRVNEAQPRREHRRGPSFH